jgi:uncharacterized membrane protein YbhN (UPF0104 family)
VNILNRFLNSKVFSIFVYAISACLFISMAYYNREYLRLINSGNLWFCIPLMFISIIAVLLRAKVNTLTFSRSSDSLSFFNGFLLSVVNTVGNYLPFSFGLVAKGMWLKRFHKTKYFEFTVVSLKTFAISLSIAGIIGLICLVLLKQMNPILVFGFSFLIALLPFSFIENIWKLPFIRRIKMIARLSAPAPLHVHVIIQTCLVYSIFYLLTGFRLFLTLKMLDIDVNYMTSLLLACASMVTRLVSVTPANMGFLEGFIGSIAAMIGMDFQLTFLAVGVERIFDIIVNFFLFYMFVHKDQIMPNEKFV